MKLTNKQRQLVKEYIKNLQSKKLNEAIPDYKKLIDYKVVGNHFQDEKFFKMAERFIDDVDNDLNQRSSVVEKYYDVMGSFPDNWSKIKNNPQKIVADFVNSNL